MQGDLILPIKTQRDDILITLVLLVAGLLTIGFPTVLLAGGCCKYLQSYRTKREYLSYLILTIGGLCLSLLHLDTFSRALTSEYQTVGASIYGFFVPDGQHTFNLTPFGIVAVSTLPLAPLLGGAMDFFKKLERALHTGDSVEDKLAYAQEQEAARQRSEASVALKYASQKPTREQPELFLGTMMRGDSLPTTEQESIQLHQRGSWITCEDRLLDEHLFVLGATGAGKSTSLLRLCAEILEKTDRDLIIVDGKGDEELAQDIRALVWKYRQHDTPIFRLGGPKAGAQYNGFCGSAESVYNRLAQMIQISAAEGNATYYADVNRDILQLICYAPGGPPRSMQELRHRLRLEWLQQIYANDPDESELVADMDTKDIESLAARLRPLTREFKNLISSEGFSLEETRTAFFSIKALSVGDSAQRFCRFLIEDFKDFVTNRAKRRGFLGIDEFGVFGNENVRDLLAQARSKHYGVCLLTQEYANLGDENLARQILANTRTKILMGTDYPEEIGKPGGTKFQIESGIQSNELGPTGMITSRIQHAFKVDMNYVRRFRPGQSFIIRNGYTVAIQISRVDVPKSDDLPTEDIVLKQSQPEASSQTLTATEAHIEPQQNSSVISENSSAKNEESDVKHVEENREGEARKRRKKPL